MKIYILMSHDQMIAYLWVTSGLHSNELWADDYILMNYERMIPF